MGLNAYSQAQPALSRPRWGGGKADAALDWQQDPSQEEAQAEGVLLPQSPGSSSGMGSGVWGIS